MSDSHAKTGAASHPRGQLWGQLKNKISTNRLFMLISSICSVAFRSTKNSQMLSGSILKTRLTAGFLLPFHTVAWRFAPPAVTPKADTARTIHPQ